MIAQIPMGLASLYVWQFRVRHHQHWRVLGRSFVKNQMPDFFIAWCMVDASPGNHRTQTSQKRANFPDTHKRNGQCLDSRSRKAGCISLVVSSTRRCSFIGSCVAFQPFLAKHVHLLRISSLVHRSNHFDRRCLRCLITTVVQKLAFMSFFLVILNLVIFRGPVLVQCIIKSDSMLCPCGLGLQIHKTSLSSLVD